MYGRRIREHWEDGISWENIFPNIDSFKNKIITRKVHEDEDSWNYIYKILNARYFDKVFRFTSNGRVLAEISPLIEVLLIMMEQFNSNIGTDYRIYESNSATATYEEDEDLDIDTENEVQERIGNRERGYVSNDKAINYSINEIINRDNRIKDYIEKKINPLFSARKRNFRRENYE